MAVGKRIKKRLVEKDPTARMMPARTKKPGRTVTSKEDVKHQLKAGARKVGRTLLPVAMSGAAGPLGTVAGFLGMRYQKKPPVGRRVRRSGSGK